MRGWWSERSRSASFATGWPRSRLPPRNELPHLGRDIAALKGHGDIGDHEAFRAAAVIALALEPAGMERLCPDHLGHGVGQLDLAAGARFLSVERPHHL